jgi:hypothetical protein
MPIEAVIFVLRHHNDFEHAGVGEVRESKVNGSVSSSKSDRWIGAIDGQRHQAFSFTSGRHHPHDVRGARGQHHNVDVDSGQVAGGALGTKFWTFFAHQVHLHLTRHDTPTNMAAKPHSAAPSATLRPRSDL